VRTGRVAPRSVRAAAKVTRWRFPRGAWQVMACFGQAFPPVEAWVGRPYAPVRGPL